VRILGSTDPAALLSTSLDRIGSDTTGVDAGAARPPSATGAGSSTSFAEALGRALGDVERLQLQGDRSAGEVATGGGNLHETALALEKADVALRVAVKVRNKLVEAYQDIMRMTV
jgi:flagellar hook-basal body complex protein FliE